MYILEFYKSSISACDLHTSTVNFKKKSHNQLTQQIFYINPFIYISEVIVVVKMNESMFDQCT